MHRLLMLLCLPTIALAQSVNTGQGILQGVNQDGVFSFKGIPYAAPPLGELRWAPPQPPLSWQRSRDATQYGSDCHQLPYSPQSPYYRELIRPSEDCLFLNVWSTALEEDRKAPVMVWIHGGGLTRGSGSTPAYDGSQFARREVVLVTINYRLNVFGYMPHAELSQEQQGSSGNYGLQDQVAALQWVRDNIAAFGGNPDNVTIFGESAGSSSVNQLLVNPQASGLFHRAIGQSGGIFRPLPELASAGHARGEKVAAALAVKTLSQMRAAPAEDVLIAFAGLEKSGVRFGAIVDGKTIPAQTISLFKSGNYNRVPSLVGYNRDEATVFALAPGRGVARNREEFAAGLDQFMPALKSDFLAAYPQQTGEKERQPYLDFWRDMVFGWNMQTWARMNEAAGSTSWMYFFTHQPPTPVGKMLGAYHAAEIVYVFGNRLPDTKLDRDLSDLLQYYWVNFATYGTPNGPDAEIWPRYGKRGRYMRLDVPEVLGQLLDSKAMAVWNKAAGL
jgi:para-nitrobenzyl esterase